LIQVKFRSGQYLTHLISTLCLSCITH